MVQERPNIPPLVDTSNGQSPRLAEAVQEISPEYYMNMPEPHALQKVVDYFKRGVKRAVNEVDLSLNQVTITLENPSSLVTAIPLVEKLRIDRALKTIESVPEGKVLVDNLRESGIPVSMRNAINYNGAVLVSDERIDGHGNFSKTPKEIILPAYSNHGRLVSFFIHELQHLRQSTAGLLDISKQKIISPIEAVWYNAAIEADAKATEMDIAYKLHKAGHSDAWLEENKRRTNPQFFVQAYEEAIAKNPQAVENGEAKRAAFDAWHEARFSSGAKISESYTWQGVTSWQGVSWLLHQEKKAAPPLAYLGAEDIRKLGTLSKVNYLDLPNGRPLDDPYYRQKTWNAGQAGALAIRHALYQSKFLPEGAENAKPEQGTSQEVSGISRYTAALTAPAAAGASKYTSMAVASVVKPAKNNPAITGARPVQAAVEAPAIKARPAAPKIG
ncbi:MAG: hypothetical protein RBS08_04555 [Bdellovibrionales bacterium]|jgi:hypothetical protein|nr:hypothetical protein [Bdellovibrionales bacterium]